LWRGRVEERRKKSNLAMKSKRESEEMELEGVVISIKRILSSSGAQRERKSSTLIASLSSESSFSDV